MIRLPAIARLLGSVALVGLAACTTEQTTTTSEGAVEQGAPEQALGNDTPETTTTTTTPDAPKTETGPTIGSMSPLNAKIAASIGIDINAEPEAPAPPVEVPATCTSNGISGNGSITVTKRSASGFVKIDSKLDGDIVIKEGKWFSVHVETDANVQGSIKAEVDDGVLVIEGQGEFCANKLQVVVTLPMFRSITVEGSGKIDIDKTGLPTDVDLFLKGSGSITFDGKALALNTSIEGSGTITLASGSAVSTNVEIEGSGKVDASGFGLGSVTKKISVEGEFKFSL
ncbi:MAG TPA: DUF2807 domain-containing protein [Labilithrix sp.]|nr:DUF2807 domain-containing protein [Labilithrix sp.]